MPSISAIAVAFIISIPYGVLMMKYVENKYGISTEGIDGMILAAIVQTPFWTLFYIGFYLLKQRS